ncbi:MAG: 4'-phosphopantetheinyl transferase superfamily protein [Prevotella sp.]|nr:4'-phosphopantetheinyl transferase superfamily protein [Prevotella sp.]
MVYLNDDIASVDWQAALPLLSEQRKEQCLKFKYERGRQTCVAAYLLLCEGLKQEYGIAEPPVFSYGEHGKPAIVGRSDVHFNLSHCREAAVCVVDKQPVGVDVESIRAYNESLAHYTMNDEEMAQIAQAERPDVAFVRLWTMKEAVLKLLGSGITDNIKQTLADVPCQIETVVNLEKNYIFSIAK